MCVNLELNTHHKEKGMGVRSVVEYGRLSSVITLFQN